MRGSTHRRWAVILCAYHGHHVTRTTSTKIVLTNPPRYIYPSHLPADPLINATPFSAGTRGDSPSSLRPTPTLLNDARRVVLPSNVWCTWAAPANELGSTNATSYNNYPAVFINARPALSPPARAREHNFRRAWQPSVYYDSAEKERNSSTRRRNSKSSIGALVAGAVPLPTGEHPESCLLHLRRQSGIAGQVLIHNLVHEKCDTVGHERQSIPSPPEIHRIRHSGYLF